MIRLRSVLFAALFGPAFLALAGCWSNTSTGSGTISAPEEQTYALTIYDIDKKQRIQYITDHVAAYVNHARQLPGSTEFLQRIMLGTIFDDLSDVLPKIAGADPGAVFRQQFHIIQSIHTQLNALTLDAPSDAIVEAGLRAASDALEDFSTKSFADQTDLATDINDLNSKIDELDTATPETHRQIEADAAVRIGAIMQRMSGMLIQRLQPATAPSTQMSIKPATMPS
jgi:outer membrane murein-binding lipoprotein Lpp